jgi:hypothetical protein
VNDFVGDHGSPKEDILCTFKNVPVAFWDVPTLNQMVFSRKLWECLLDNQYLKQSMENGSHWGESKHADRDEVYLDEVACRVNNFWLGDKNIVFGDVDIPDTRKGRDVYKLARIGRVGISSRGFGELRDMDNGLKEVIPDQYMHVCWDMVAFPAVPDAHMTLATEDSLYDETLTMSTELRKLVDAAIKKNPHDKALQRLVSGVKAKSNRLEPDIGIADIETAILSHEIKKLQVRGYTPLHSNDRSGIMSAGGTFSEAVEGLHKRLIERHPDLNWKLKTSVFKNGWYDCVFNSVPTSSEHYYAGVKFDKRVFRIRRKPNGVWDIKENR